MPIGFEFALNHMENLKQIEMQRMKNYGCHQM